MPTKKLRVLFVCIGNACRSPMAEAIAKREAADVLEASSAGLYPLGEIPDETQETLSRNGYSAVGLSSKPITNRIWNQADLVINLSGRIRDIAFDDPSKVEDWDVADPYNSRATPTAHPSPRRWLASATQITVTSSCREGTISVAPETVPVSLDGAPTQFYVWVL
jgi:protein-tyrosine-phosphatase